MIFKARKRFSFILTVTASSRLALQGVGILMVRALRIMGAQAPVSLRITQVEFTRPFIGAIEHGLASQLHAAGHGRHRGFVEGC